MAIESLAPTGGAVTGASNGAHSPFISVDSVWKVFGRNPERVLEPRYAEMDKNTVQNDLGNVIGLQDVSFSVEQGETFVIMGLSGSGKSTMVRCLIRLIEPTAGSIVIDGDDITAMSDKDLIEFRRNKIAMVFQHYGLMPHRSVIDNASWGLEVQGVDQATRYARTREILDLVGLTGWEDAYPRQLSGGMQQRVGLARALAVNTGVLLMDEPFSGLDPLIRRQMQDELVRLQDELHKTIVFITHDLNEALKLGDRIAIMHDGRVAQIGSPEDIVLRPEDSYVGDFTQDVRIESILTARKVMVPPAVTFPGHLNPRAALDAFGRANHRFLGWVVDEVGRYIGALSHADAERASKAGAARLDQVEECLDQEYPVLTPATNFDELIPVAMGVDHALPVVDDDRLLVGEVHRADVAEALASAAAESPDYEANAAENAAQGTDKA